MATLGVTTNLVATDTTSPIGAAQVDRTLDINASANVNQTSQTFAVSGGSDSQVAIGSITAANGYQLEIINEEDPDTGPDLDLSTATGGSFAGAKFGKVKAGLSFTGWFTAAVYGKSSSASVTCRCSIRAIEYVAP